VYFGFRQYQLHFDFAGLGILFAALVVLYALVWQLVRGRHTTSLAIATVLLFLCGLQSYRGAMVPNSAWLAMLGAVENSGGEDRDRRVRDLVGRWNVDAGTMRTADWYAISTRWGVCHTLWVQAECTNTPPSELAFGVAREKLHDIIVSGINSRAAQ
jgi:hypothetical protein